MSEPDSPTDRRATVRRMALLMGSVVLMALVYVWLYLGRTLPGMVSVLIMGGLLIVLVVWVVVDLIARPHLARLIALGTALLVTVGVAVPLVLRQAELNGSGIVWQADPAIGDGLEPYAVVGGAVVLEDGARLVFLDLADGHLRGTLPKRSSTDRLFVAGDRLLVASGDQFRLYDDSAQAVWPEPIIADAAVAAADDVVVLQRDCGHLVWCGFGFDPAGREVWQRRISAYLPFSESIRLPDRIASNDRAGWTILDAADGRTVGAIEGDWVFATGSHVNAFTANDGECRVRGVDRPPGDAFDCTASLTIRWIDEQLISVEGPDGHVTALRLDGAGGQLEELDRSATNGSRGEVQLGRLGWARLSDRRLEFGDWPSGLRAADRHTGPLPIEPEGDAGSPAVTVEGGTVVVIGSAAPTFGVDTRERRLMVFDFAGGEQTAHLRLPGNGATGVLDPTLSTGPGQALICLPGRPPMLIGRPT